MSVAAVDSEFRALVFSKTAGFRHGSIPTGIAAIEALGEENGFEVDKTEDASLFTDENLAQYDVVIWLSTTGDVLNDDQQAAFERYIQAGGGYAGVHAASDTEYNWPWYEDLVGAYFKGHPANQNADIIVEDNTHPSTSHLGDTWTRFDEWYDFRTNPRSDTHVLLSLDESSYTGATMGLDHPIAWCQSFDGGRAWYTGLGHTNESFAEPAFLEHLLGGIRTAAGAENAACNESNAEAYEVVQLDANTDNPMSLSVTEDGTVFYVERNGRVQRIDKETQQVTTALNLNVTLGNEDGLLGLVLDPDFETNQWAYVYWSPATVTPADGPHNRLSRFTYDPSSNSFDVASEQTLLKVTTQRDTCCHAGGDMVFDLDGNLILATGDNTNPFESSGYTPIDERPGRTNYDAQATSGNTNDLRGKLIRITPQDDGTYTVPDGNLFEPGTAQTREEIYAMGFRNPFRIGMDPYTGNVLVADYGPDAGSANPNRGPAATTEWNIVSQPGNYGWPYCHGVKCYNDFNFANNTSGAVFDPNNLVNNSPNNTGLTNLPPVIKPTQWGEQGATSTNPWREIGNGSGYTGAPMAGPVYKYDPDLESDTKWPAYWDNKALFGDWNAGQLFTMQLNREGEARNTEIVSVKRLFPEIFSPSAGFYRAMDMEFGPDGALYVIDWGQGFGGNNASSGIYRVDYVEGNPSPIARAGADTTSGAEDSLTVNFNSEGTRHPAGLPVTYSWNFGDGSEVSTEENPTHTYNGVGEYTAQLTVTDPDGRTGIASVQIVVGNAMPTVSIVFPENGGFFEWGDEVAYKVVVDDPDASGEIDCSKVQVLPALGHDSHQHPWGELSGCEGSIPTGRDAGHGITSNIFWVVDVRYTDDGGAAGVPLTGYATNLLTPKHLEAEFFVATGNLDGPGGVETETTGDAGGGLNLSYVDVNDWWSYEPINFKGIDGLRARLAAPTSSPTGEISIRWNDPAGPEIGTIPFTSTGAWQTYQYFDAELGDLPAETGTLYFVLTSGAVNVNYYDWIGKGVDGNALPIVSVEVDNAEGPAPLTVNATATATDPEGTEVSYQWKQGNGDDFVAGEASETFVYDVPGTYTLTVRATDEQGAYADATTQIVVKQPDMGMCFSGRSDGFDGANLDNERWNRIVRPNQDARVEDGHLVIPASKTDIYGNGGNTPNLILQDLPSGAFTATTKVTIEARANYQQAGLLIYGDDDNYAKLVIQGRNAGAEGRIIQFIREENGQPNEVAASNTSGLGAAFPDTVYLRFTSDGSNLKAAYSADGETFTEMPETKALAGISNPRIGMMALSNSSSTPAVIDAKFDWFSITPDDTASTGGPNDEFDGTALDACRWQVLNPNPNAYRVVDGQLQIDTANTDIYEGATGVENFIVQNQPGDEWTVETKLDVSELDRQYQQGGLIVYTDDDNYVKLDVVSRNAAGSATNREVEFRSEIGGAVQNPQPNAAAPADGIVWLRLAKAGNVFTGSYSTDGQNWTTLGDTLTNAPAATGKVGVFALGSTSQGNANRTVYFDYFKVLGGDEELEVSHELDPAVPNGDNDWYTGPVEVTVNVTGGGESSVYREVKVNDGEWAEYTAPITVTADGEHVVEYRASGSGSEPVTGSVSFKIDATAPTSTASVAGTGAERTLTITGTDETSGVATLEYRIGDGEWAVFTEGVVLAEGAQTVTHRATDAAGNVSADSVLEVPGDLDVSTVATTRCVAGKVYLALQVDNAEGVPVAVTLESAYGTKVFPAVKAGGKAAHLFNTRAISIDEGTVNVSLTATIDGEERTSQYQIQYGGTACG